MPDDQDPTSRSDDEALRLVLAFYSILEPERQAEVLALAEKYAGVTSDHTDRALFKQ